MAESPKSQLCQFDSHFYWKQPLLSLSGVTFICFEEYIMGKRRKSNIFHQALVEEIEKENQEPHSPSDLKEEVLNDGNKQEFMDICEDKTEHHTFGGGIAQEENYGCLSKEEVATDSRGWSLEQPKSEESWREAGLEGAEGGVRLNGEFIEGRLSRLGLGSYGDEAALKSEESRIGKFGMGGFKANLEESQNVSRSILDDCVQMVVEERSLLKKDGFKEIFDADDDEVQEEKNEDGTAEGLKSRSNSPKRSTSRPSPTPRLAAWLLKAGASEAQVPNHNFFHQPVMLYTCSRCCLRDVLQLQLLQRGAKVK